MLHLHIPDILLEKGWKGSRKSVPAAYLYRIHSRQESTWTRCKGCHSYTLEPERYTQRMAAALKGVIDAGVEVPANEETFPSDDRINGEHLTVKNEVSKIKSTIDSEAK